MSELILAGDVGKLMSSLEISELVEKRHDNVKRVMGNHRNNRQPGDSITVETSSLYLGC